MTFGQKGSRHMRMFMSIVKVEIKLPEAHHAIVAFAENRMLAPKMAANLVSTSLALTPVWSHCRNENAPSPNRVSTASRGGRASA